MYQVVKRDGKIADFDLSKIVAAITKAYEVEEAQRSEAELSNYHEYVQIMAEFDWPAFWSMTQGFIYKSLSVCAMPM